MTNEKNLLLVKQYREHLKRLRASMIETDYNSHFHDREDALNHLFSMLTNMENFLREGRREKFFRWLGFMQGVLWSLGEFSLNELRDHNRPPE